MFALHDYFPPESDISVYLQYMGLQTGVLCLLHLIKVTAEDTNLSDSHTVSQSPNQTKLK